MSQTPDVCFKDQIHDSRPDPWPRKKEKQKIKIKMEEKKR